MEDALVTTRNSLGESQDEWSRAFGDAARWFAATSAVEAAQLTRPALGEWSVRDLLGHTARALSTVESYLDVDSQDPITVASTVEYFEQAVVTADPAQVAERGRQAGASLGADPARAVGELADRVLAALDQLGDDARCRTPFGTMLLSEYLPTRTFELTVHTCDLAAALGVPGEPPPGPALSALRAQQAWRSSASRPATS